MKDKKIDLFLSNLLTLNCYNIKTIKRDKIFWKIERKFFLILKTPKLLLSKDCKNFNINLRSKLITFRKKNFKCRIKLQL